MDLKQLHSEVGCLGYYGFGTGFAMAKRLIGAEGQVCSGGVCPMTNLCWKRHKDRARLVEPILTRDFEELAKILKGAELVITWQRKAGLPDPYTVMMIGNVNDGVAVGAGGRPKNRGKYTMPWPLKPS